MNHYVKRMLSWPRRVATAAATALRRSLGRPVAASAGEKPRSGVVSFLATTRRRMAQPRVYLGLSIATVAVAATLFIALHRMTASRQESFVPQSEVGLAAAAGRGAADGEALQERPRVEYHAEPAAGDHFVSQRQRKGMALFGGFVVVTVLLLVLGRRFGC